MEQIGPRHSMEEFKRRGDAVYEREVRQFAEPVHNGRYVVIDIDTGAFEIADDEMTASERLLARVPDAQVWMRRVGAPHARRFGAQAQTDRRSPR